MKRIKYAFDMTLDSGQTFEQKTPPPSRIELKIQDGEKVTPLRVDDFNVLFFDMAGFNDQFSLGSMTSGIIERYLGASEDITSLSKYDEQFQQFTAGKDLYNQLFTHLCKCLDMAISDLENIDESKGKVYDNEYRNRLMPILQEIKQAFE